MLFSKVKFYCNNCGKEVVIEWAHFMGREFKVCSTECIKEIQYKITCSIMGQSVENK